MESGYCASLLECNHAQRPGLREDASAIWDLSELGFLEKQSAAILIRRLEAAGFEVQLGTAGMPTAFIARFCARPGPVIGILAEYDALPGLSQKACPHQEKAPGRSAGHGCGHNLIGAASAAVAAGLAAWMRQENIPGEIRVYGCPAEEGGAAKAFLAREGAFAGTDAVIHWHPHDANGFYASPHMACLIARVSFRGVAAHAAASPELGRSALDGLQLMAMALEFLREHIPDKSRIQYTISSGGASPNIVPDYAAMHLCIRHRDADVVRDIWRRALLAAKGAAMATETSAEWEILSGMHGLLISRTLLETAEKAFRSVRIVPWNAEEAAFAEEIRQTLVRPGKLDSAAIKPPFPAEEINASTDVGDVSWTVPTVGILSMCWVPGTPAHSWQAVAASGSSIGFRGAETASEVIARTAAELFLHPEILQKARAEMLSDTGEGFRYEPLIGSIDPPLDYQKAFAGG